MNASELHTKALDVQLTSILNNMQNAANAGKFSYYTIDCLDKPVIAALEQRGFQVKPGYSGGHHVLWSTI